MDDKLAIKLDNVSKTYRVYKSNHQKVAHELLGLNKGVPFTALKNIDLEIKKGENVGIIGTVGSGRSTLAKIISGVSSPTEGTAEADGKVLPVFDLRSGFDLNFTGRENIHVKGCMLGWSKNEIQEREQTIIDFADLGDLISLKMKGFKPVDRSRLGFSMILQDDSDIIVVDCPLAVGTLVQRARCVEKMQEWAEDKSRTLVMVNTIWQITGQLCERGIVLDGGELKYDGPFDQAIELYRKDYRIDGKEEKSDNEEDAHSAGPDVDEEYTEV